MVLSLKLANPLIDRDNYNEGKVLLVMETH